MSKTKDEMMSIRTRVAQEILSTERTFVDSLRILQDLYINPLKERTDILSPEEHCTIFGNISIIYSLNQKFLSDFEARMKSWDETTIIGDIFLNYSAYFKMYTSYCDGHEKAVQEYRRILRRREAMKTFHKNATLNPESRSLTLESFLIMPIQRIPRYKLLLQVILKNCPEDHPDYEILKQALDAVAVVAKNINEAIRDRENRDKVFEIQEMFTSAKRGKRPILVEPGRRFIMEGPLTKVCRKQDKQFHFFLFNNLLVYAKRISSSAFLFHRLIPIDSAFLVVDLPYEEDKCSFQIRNSNKSFVVYASDEAYKNKWLAALNDCMAESMKARNAKTDNDAAPIWVPDHLAQNCSICSSSFVRLVRHRHHCRKCGALVCNKCSLTRMVLKNSVQPKPLRVCDKCVHSLKGQEASKGDESDAESEMVAAEECRLSIRSPGATKDPNNLNNQKEELRDSNTYELHESFDRKSKTLKLISSMGQLELAKALQARMNRPNNKDALDDLEKSVDMPSVSEAESHHDHSEVGADRDEIRLTVTSGMELMATQSSTGSAFPESQKNKQRLEYSEGDVVTVIRRDGDIFFAEHCKGHQLGWCLVEHFSSLPLKE